MIPRYETDAQGMKDSTRYEKCAQGIQLLHKGMKCFFRYETRVFLKNSGFSYLYGSTFLGMNKSVPGVKPTAVGMKWQFPRYEKNEQEV